VPYLKPKQEYVDSYDRLTVDYCREKEKEFEDIRKTKNKKVPEKDTEEYLDVLNKFLALGMYCIIGDKYEQKEKTIKEWMERDGKKDEKLENAEPPLGIRCLVCGSEMDPNFRDLFGSEERVIFMYDCPKGCHRRAFYMGGEEYIPKHLNVDDTDIDLSISEKKPDPDFLKDRERFCLTEKKGRDYITAKESIEKATEHMRMLDEKEKNQEALSKIEKLTVSELEKFLIPKLSRHGYMNLKFGTPDLGKIVSIPFTVNDTNSQRGEGESSYDLKRIIHKVLKDVNWRLMSEGVSYRVGILSGRLRAYEKDEDILKLIKK
jgi:hypothetical protein